jgi:hypothetical protein
MSFQKYNAAVKKWLFLEQKVAKLHIQKHPLQPKLQIFYEFDFCYVLSKD